MGKPRGDDFLGSLLRTKQPVTPNRPLLWLRALLWLYFALIIGEGVLRKWVFPGLSDVLFIIRDPLVVLIYLFAWMSGRSLGGSHIIFLGLLAVLSLAFVFSTDTPWMVALFGLRTNFLHLPLIFVMGSALDREDVRRYARVCLWLAIPVVALMLVQFNSPRTAWVNVGVGGQESGQILGALERIRPPGPFSFISGLVLFFNLTGAFVLAGWLHREGVSRLLLLVATVACFVALPVSISRSLLFTALVIGAFGLMAALRDARRLPRYFAPAIVAGVMLAAATDSVYVEAFQTRWNDSLMSDRGSFESNILDRVINDYTQPFQQALNAPLTGHGIGLGTLAGARLTTGKKVFLLAESEWSRIVLEIGPLLGFAFIGWRVWLAFSLLLRSWRQLRIDGDPLAWMLAGAAFFPMLNSQWGPSTHLGFAVFTAGLSLAALNPPEDEIVEEADDEETEDAALKPT